MLLYLTFFFKLKLYTSFSKLPVLESNQYLSLTWKLNFSLRLSNHETRKSHEFCGLVKDLLELRERVAADKNSLYP